MKTIRHHPNGFALIAVLVLVAVAGTLGISYLASASVKVSSSVNMAQAVRCRYLAEAGIEHALHIVRTDILGVGGPGTARGPFQIDGTSDSYWFYGQATGTDDEILLVGTGQVGNLTRTVSATVRTDNDYFNQMMNLGPMSYWRMDDESDQGMPGRHRHHPLRRRCVAAVRTR